MSITTEPPAQRAATASRTAAVRPADDRGQARRILPSDRYGIAVLFAVILASLALLPLTTDPSYAFLGAAFTVGICALGVVGRRLNLDPLVILLAQLAAAGLGLFGLVQVAGNADLGPFAKVPDIFGQGIVHMAAQTVPMEPNPGITLMFLTGVAVLAIMTDHLVQTVERPLWALAPILTPYLITALMPTVTAPWWSFVAMALGFLIVLTTEGVNRAGRWTRGITDDSAGRAAVGPLVWRSAAVVGIPAIVLALVAAMVVPVRYSDGNWALTPQTGSGGPLQLQNPAQDLKRNLTQPEDRVVMTYQSNADDPGYLRMATLPVLNEQGFSGAPIALQRGTDLPPPPGLSDVPDPSVQTEIQIREFNSQYLPLPYPSDAYAAEGDWSYDPTSLMVIASGEDPGRATNGLQYSVTSYPEEPDGAGLSQAPAGQPADFQLSGEIPADLPPEIIDLTNEITNDAPTPALKAAAIQSFLRSDEFTYSLEPSDSSGYAALQQFLLEDRQGFCVQFAGAMTVMARIVGIPSRMAVGFLPGTAVGNDNYEVNVRNMHAWPELYFEGYGWVRFEPTPNVASPPAWSQTSAGPAIDSNEPEPTEVPEPDTDSEPTTSAAPVPVPPEAEEPPVEAADWYLVLTRIAIAVGVLALLAALASIPALLRAHRRRARLSGTGSPRQQVEDAWSEVRDLVVDHGHDWPSASPRETGRLVAGWVDGAAAQSAQRLSVLVERSRFSRDYATTDNPAPLALRVQDGLAANEPGRMSRFATRMWPRSVFIGRFGKRGLR